MADSLTIDVDATALLRLFDEVGEAAGKHAKEVAMVTAAAIDREATARVRRREGQTATNIVHKDRLPDYLGGSPSFNRTAVFVYVEAVRRPDNLALWLEFGTKHMTKKPFLFEAARLEEGPHMRRLAEALQTAINEASR